MNIENSSKKLLVVDDSKVSRMVIRAHVHAIHPDWQIIEAASGDEAIPLAAQESPDYCTMDINMPGMLGTDAAEQILTVQPHLKIVIFSANIQETFQARAIDLGLIFIAKPVTAKSIGLALNYFAA